MNIVFSVLIFIAVYSGLSLLDPLFEKDTLNKKDPIQQAYFEGCYTGASLGDLPVNLDGEAAEIYINDYCREQAKQYTK
jgi:hypothetical protein